MNDATGHMQDEQTENSTPINSVPSSDYSPTFTRAIKEVDLLQSIVVRHSDLAFRTRGWLFALLTAMAIGQFTGAVKLSAFAFVFMSYGIISMFLCMELIQRVPQWRAIKRIGIVEATIREERTYDGPRITEELSPAMTLREFQAQLFNPFVYIPYVMLLCIIAVIGLLTLSTIPPSAFPRDAKEPSKKAATVPRDGGEYVVWQRSLNQDAARNM